MRLDDVMIQHGGALLIFLSLSEHMLYVKLLFGTLNIHLRENPSLIFIV